MSKFTCRMCAGSNFDDPVEHFETQHPGHLSVITLGDIYNQTRLIYSDRSKAIRTKAAPVVGAEDVELPLPTTKGA